MMIFSVVAALLLAAALLFIVPSLWRRHGRQGVQRDRSNLEIYKDQLAELEVDLNAGTLSQEQFEHGRLELERRLLDDVAQQPAPPVIDDKGAGRGAAVSLALFVPLLAVLIYLIQGTPDGISPEKTAAMVAGNGEQPSHEITMDQIQNMVAKLAERMETNPEDTEGWLMLGRSYGALGRYAEAGAALERAVALQPDNADLLVDYADVLAMSSGETLEGKPAELIARALSLDPNNQKGLWLAGTAAFDRGDYNSAIGYWEHLLGQLPPGSQEAQAMTNNIAEARAQGGQGGPATAATPAAEQMEIQGTVRLKPELAARAAPSDTVFVFARPVQGPRMPVAILRVQVKDLPLQFNLNDSQAVTPMARLSGYTEVAVGARISKSGNAMPESGDLEGIVNAVQVGSSGINVVIDTVVP